VEPTESPGVFRHGKELYSRNATPGLRVYGEELRTEQGVEYRHWDPWRSKLAALLLKSGGRFPLPVPHRVLYLGGAHGTTVSHLSDLWPDAQIFVVEKSPTSFAPLLALSRRRTNLLPLLADAQLPERYVADVGVVDFLYQDVAQRGQARIFLENAAASLGERGVGVLMLKVRSVTQARPADQVLNESRAELDQGGLAVVSTTDLAPFSREHVAVRATR
jgi:fibrillarin-like pre-rRNA processing protein